ncbi:hypothetical protein [Chiayiivirga flava]|uniref:Uncharacterized protein n=1 Tax=Chiayiivirga flava TaxID=659595 RepID=A0A7W8DAC2_9GAMM|nr:hypothetical protein [Chiayiivirga flava]MBB5209058.1 hypothetical protein [Chiayiivirga flava]
MKWMRRIFISCLMVPAAAAAYEIETHAWIMHQGYLRSDLASGELRTRLGFDRLVEQQPFQVFYELPSIGSRDAYLDVVPDPLFGQSSDAYLNPIYHRPPTPYERQRFVYTSGPADPNSTNGLFLTPHTVGAALVRGAVREDDLLHDEAGQELRDADPHGDIFRVFNHFYDPINDRGLTIPLGCNFVLSQPCYKSVDWALGTTDAFSTNFSPMQNRRNHFSWNDAREHLWQALTFKSAATNSAQYAVAQARDSGLRRVYWNSSLKSIGHTVHLLQDTAQPQHTRNDRHNPPGNHPFGTDENRRMMEAFANLRVTGNLATTGGDFHRIFRNMVNAQPAAGLTSPPAAGNYPVPKFSTPLKFFTTRSSDLSVEARRGLADYSNRGYYSDGTKPGQSDDYDFPPQDLTDPGFTLGYGATVVQPGYGTLQRMNLYHEVPDLVAPTHPDACEINGKLPVLSVSALSDFQAVSSAALPMSSLSFDTYKCNQDNLLPRAIAYSAGLVNHFFRGTLEIQAPPQRVLAVVDQGVAHSVDSNGYPRRTDNNEIFGFEKLRLRVKNSTSDILESGTQNTYSQTIGGSNGPSSGRMVAIARYHRNPCYQPDMSGERRVTMPLNGTLQPPVNCPTTGSRTHYDEISVSAAVSVAPGDFGTGSGASFKDMMFDFTADPIPVNATDLFIQVVYRGPLGEEADGIALGTYDAREPMFVSFWNNTDYYNQNGAWASAVGSTGVYRKAVKNFQFCAGVGADRTVLIQYNSLGSPAMSFPEPAGYMRFAVIPAKPVASENVILRGNPSFFDPQPPIVYEPPAIGVSGTINQANKERIGLATAPYPLASAPLASCPTTPPSNSEFIWCVEPILVRRGLAGGKVAQPIYLTNSVAPSPVPDAGSLPAFALPPVQNVASNYWNTSLTPCPLLLTGWTVNLEEILGLEEQLLSL